MKKLVSIIIPVFNIENYIIKCLDSCLSQTYDNIEIIVVDDGSTDNSSVLVKEYASLYNKVKLYSQINSGVVIAREKGISISKGEYLCFVDGDDYIDPTMIESLVNKAETENCDIVSCDFKLIEDSEHFALINTIFNSYLGFSKNDIIESLLLKKCTWSLWGKIFKRELFDGICMPPYDMKIGEDGIICFQLYDKSIKVSHIPFSFYNYIQRKSSAFHLVNNYKNLNSLITFMEFISEFIKNYLDNQSIKKSFHSFLLSQMFVFYIKGGDFKYLKSRFHIPFSNIKEIFSLHNNLKEKLLVYIFINFPRISIVIRKIYYSINS